MRTTPGGGYYSTAFPPSRLLVYRYQQNCYMTLRGVLCTDTSTRCINIVAFYSLLSSPRPPLSNPFFITLLQLTALPIHISPLSLIHYICSAMNHITTIAFSARVVFSSESEATHSEGAFLVLDRHRRRNKKERRPPPPSPESERKGGRLVDRDRIRRRNVGMSA